MEGMYLGSICYRRLQNKILEIVNGLFTTFKNGEGYGSNFFNKVYRRVSKK